MPLRDSRFLESDNWPDSPQADLARRILPDYVHRGPAQFVANADVTMRLWRVGDQVVPVAYRERPQGGWTTDVCSPWSHYVRYPLHEMKRRGGGLRTVPRRFLLQASGLFLRFSDIENVVFVNNWLLSTNPAVHLDDREIQRMTATLSEEFPERAILLRTINPTTDRELAARLSHNGYRLVASRTVHVLDPFSRAYRRSENARVDRRLLHDGRYEQIGHEELTADDMPRVAELHRLLYTEKHTALNAAYTSLFFETAWRNRFLEFQALRQDGRIEGFVAWYELDGVVTPSLMGYDTRRPQELGLFRRGMALQTEHARSRGLPLNWSAGAGAFKHHRGGQPSIEYDAVFDRHLPRHRRIGWQLLKAAGWFQQRKVQRGW
jgi:hypothetical protein